jgi:tellurite resistance protein
MSFEEEAAYAISSWRRFDAEVTDDLARAITSAFILVAVADGDLAQSEIDRFNQLMHEHADLLNPNAIDRFDLLFNDIGSAIMSDPHAGRAHALELIAAVKTNEIYCELVRSAAEIAILADNRELDSEKEVLEIICDTMNIATRADFE